MLKTFALRSREIPLTIYGPRGLDELFATLRRIFGRLTYPVEIVELEPGARLERDGYSSTRSRSTIASHAIGYALVEDERPGRFDVEEATRLGVPDGRERGAAPARGERDPCGRASGPARAMSSASARAGRKVVLARRHGARGVGRRGGRGRRPPRPRGDVPRRRARPRPRDAALDRRRGGAGRARGRREAARAHPRLDPLLRPPGRRGGHAALPGDGRAARLRPRHDPVPRARRAGARPLGRANALRPARTNSIRVDPTSPSVSST